MTATEAAAAEAASAVGALAMTSRCIPSIQDFDDDDDADADDDDDETQHLVRCRHLLWHSLFSSLFAHPD